MTPLNIGISASGVHDEQIAAAEEIVEPIPEEQALAAARAVLDALAGLHPDTSDLTETQTAQLAGPTPQLQLTDPICCFIPGRGLWMGQLGWAIAPDYMAAMLRSSETPSP